MINKINIAAIVRDHCLTLKEFKNDRIDRRDIALFFAIPPALAGAMVILGVKVNKDLVNTLVTALSVFGALLFNLLMLIYDLLKRDEANSTMRGFLKEIYSNIAYCVLVTVITITCLIGHYLNTESAKFTSIISVISFSLLIHFMLTLLMVLRRTHTLLTKEGEREPSKGRIINEKEVETLKNSTQQPSTANPPKKTP